MRKVISDTVIAFYSKNPPKFSRSGGDVEAGGPIRDIKSEKGPMTG